MPTLKCLIADLFCILWNSSVYKKGPTARQECKHVVEGVFQKSLWANRGILSFGRICLV